MQNDAKALLSISLVCHGQLVKMIITLESWATHGIFLLKFAYLNILRLSLVRKK